MYWMISTRRKIVQIGRTKSTARRRLMCKKSMIVEMMVVMIILGMFLIGTSMAMAGIRTPGIMIMTANVLRYGLGLSTIFKS
jgi:hypothetical protein